jgi:hypothetical protein
MVRADASFLKQNRMNEISKEIAKLITKHKQDVPLKRLLAWISMNIGLTHETALKYLTDICELKGWILDIENDVIHDPSLDAAPEPETDKRKGKEDKRS